MDISKLKPSGSYWLEHWFEGELISITEPKSNLVPDEGLQLVRDALFASGAIPANWYIGLYETDYTPTQTVTAATVNALAVECVAYSETTRQQFVAAPSGIGAVTSFAERAEFTMTAVKNVYGFFLSSQPTKGSPSGVLLSCFKAPSPESLKVGSVLRVGGNFSIISTS